MGLLEDFAIGFILGKVALSVYNTIFTPKQRKQIEEIVKTHHFEYGVAAATSGIITKSPKAVGTGISFMVDDWQDKDIAIENLKNKLRSALNQIQQNLSASSYSRSFNNNPRTRQSYRRINY